MERWLEALQSRELGSESLVAPVRREAGELRAIFSASIPKFPNPQIAGTLTLRSLTEPVSAFMSLISMRLSRAASAVLVASLSAGCGGPQSAPAQLQAPPPTAVEIAAARLSSVEDSTEYVGTLKSLRSTTIQPQIDGQITEILVKSGDRVAQGAPLVKIDPQRQEAAVSSQQAERGAKEAAVTYARQQQQRVSELHAAGAVSKQELEQAETALRTAEADLTALQTKVQQQQVQLRYYTVNAPTAGVVGDVPVRVGMQVTSQTLLTTLDQNEILEANLSVPIERAGALTLGLPVIVMSSDGEQTLAMTTVSFISPRVDDQTQSILVKAQVRNPTLALRASQFVRARVIWKTNQALTIPVTAVLRINGQFFAFVAEDAAGKLVAHQRAITLGPITGDAYLVLDGIKAGDKVIVSGIQKLGDGAPVAPAS
ncbi:MAG: efflux RND transporter periplasmic adaptor subunit [Acidobacteria bacterium]|nr:efflux RND transporter periplasmic adaptor subunit [Acidobacteriota bacterium]